MYRHEDDNTDRAWLEQFEPIDRNPVAQFFNRIAREGAGSPEAVVVRVAAYIASRLAQPWGDPRDRQRMQVYLDGLRSDPAGARHYAASVLAWVALPEAERNRLKVERGRTYQHEYMATQPATERQIAFLARLGWDGAVPESKAAASDLINTLLAEGGR